MPWVRQNASEPLGAGIPADDEFLLQVELDFDPYSDAFSGFVPSPKEREVVALTGHETRHCDELRGLVSRKSWTKWLAWIISVTVLCASLDAQTPQAAASTSTDRITFTSSVKEVATIQPQFASAPSATLVRSELVPARSAATLDFSIALKMHNFAELQERTSKGQIISLDEIASK
jgi:hypothetical protein